MVYQLYAKLLIISKLSILHLFASMVYEMSEDGKVDSLLDEDDQVSFHSPSLWRFQAHVTVEHLRQRLEGMVSGEKGVLLKAITE